MILDVETIEHLTVVTPHGDLDTAAADRFKRVLDDLLAQQRLRILLDLGAVPYLDSTGLGALVSAMRRVRAVGGDIRVCALQPDVRSVLEITRLTKIITVHGSRADAIDAWRE